MNPYSPLRHAVNRGPDPERVNQLWDTWLIARTRAMRSGKLADGIEAGRAWRTFLEQFTSPPLVPADEGGAS